MHYQPYMNRRIQVILVLLALVAWMVLNMAVPVLPQLQAALHASPREMKWSLSLAIFGFAVTQVPWGVWSDHVGRRPVFLLSLGGSLLGFIAILLAPYAGAYLVGMAVIGAFMGAVPVLVRASLADRLEKRAIIRSYAWISLASTIAPFVANFVGDGLNSFFGWQMVFAFSGFLVLYVMWLCFRYIPETIAHKVANLSLKMTYQQIKALLSSKIFWRYNIVFTLISAYMISYYASLTYWFYMEFHLSLHSIAWLALPSIMAYGLGSVLMHMLLQKFSENQLLKLTLQFVVLIALLPLVVNWWGEPNFILVISVVSLFSLASGIVIPLSNSVLVHHLRQYSAILPGFMSGSRCALGALLVPLMSSIHFANYLEFGGVMLLVSLLSVVGFWYFAPANKTASLQVLSKSE